MKLINSKAEQDFRIELIKSKDSLFGFGSRLLPVLKKIHPQMTTAYILDWIPEQGEDIYTILIDDAIITTIELEKNGAVEPIIEIATVVQYLDGLARRNQIQLAVALDLVRDDMLGKM
ncbi:hypothetical protein [Chitinophaga arvensicola]|uniref:Uncharacterized protein n=1 Tax=Chitinophaga arvensicola TaxID=29529 RepID=A0A1I0S7T4_9BACT|nr:hypothetical protein [Chitinophaga arvensicola]SEW51864.1 hypothetical protein SAMN04488122_4549 [Chitinophaga arvensicola]